MAGLLYKDEVYAIVGAALEVHRVLGCGFLEPVYQFEIGLLINFGAESLEWKRMVKTKKPLVKLA